MLHGYVTWKKKRRLVMFCKMWIKCVYISKRKNKGFPYENQLSQGYFFDQCNVKSASSSSTKWRGLTTHVVAGHCFQVSTGKAAS